jgi:hypothetical protein
LSKPKLATERSTRCLCELPNIAHFAHKREREDDAQRKPTKGK